MKKIRVWDSRALTDVYSMLMQIQHNLEQIVNHTKANSLNDLPNSALPTSSLYEVTLAYEFLYEKTLEADLLNTGNIKQTSTLH